MKPINEIRRQVSDRLGVQLDRFERMSVCVFPEFLIPDEPPAYVLSKILSALGLVPQPYSPWKRYDLFICFEDQTTCTFNVEDYISRNSKLWNCDEKTGAWNPGQVGRFINNKCTDISKRRVASIFQDVFGYSLEVDPTTHQGLIVQKANLNATNAGKVIEGPMSIAEFERLSNEVVLNIHVNNIVGDLVEDLRIPWLGHISPTLYRKQRPVLERFSNANTRVFIEPVSDHLTEEEIEKFSEFCRVFGLDFGEVDCLRDRETRLLYIVDVNKTPAGPPNALSYELRSEAVIFLAVEFAREFLMTVKQNAFGATMAS